LAKNAKNPVVSPDRSKSSPRAACGLFCFQAKNKLKKSGRGGLTKFSRAGEKCKKSRRLSGQAEVRFPGGLRPFFVSRQK
jgi:hypothetical protein